LGKTLPTLRPAAAWPLAVLFATGANALSRPVRLVTFVVLLHLGM
jgi:hypothetical protein